MSPKERKLKQIRLLEVSEELHKLSYELGYGDPSVNRLREIVAAIKLGHQVAETNSGPDAFDSDGNALEYKSTNQKNCQGSYTGVSNAPHWEEMDKYLRDDKILPYKYHYYNRFNRGILVESWRLTGEKVYEIIMPKLRKQYFSDKIYADPRPNASISNTEIKKYGERVL
tara:strand:+ start:8535 stop:9044 length:510 start_codon:yes stop_codon:yes gene_type:complete